MPLPFSRHSWLAAALLTALPLTFALGREMWEAPYPINETVGILADASILSDSADSPHSLSDPGLLTLLDPTRRSWYRPAYWITWYGFWHATHSLETTLLLFRLLEVGAATLLVAGLIWHARPRTFVEYAAITFAVSVLVGMPGFRDNLELPLLMTLVGMLFALMVWILLEREHARWHGPLIVLLTVLAIGFKEQGLVLVPIVVVAWWVRAPGARAGTAVTLTLLTMAYLAMRFSTAGSWRPFEQDVGFGFETVSSVEASERFGAFPYGIYAYNMVATVANLLFSEPTNGVFRMVHAIAVEGNPRPWMMNHLLTSTLTTALLVWWGVRTVRRDLRDRAWSPESRLAIALVVAIAASGALGFNYSRERLGGMAVVFYALASFYALRAAAARLADVGGWRVAMAAAALLLVAAGWQLRAIGTVDAVQARSYRTYREWIAGRHEARIEHLSEPRYLRIFAAMEPQGLVPVRGRTTSFLQFADRMLGSR